MYILLSRCKILKELDTLHRSTDVAVLFQQRFYIKASQEFFIVRFPMLTFCADILRDCNHFDSHSSITISFGLIDWRLKADQKHLNSCTEKNQRANCVKCKLVWSELVSYEAYKK